MSKFNQQEYISNYIKEHYAYFRAGLSKKEYNKLDSYLKKRNFTKAGFVRKIIENLNEVDKIIFKK